MSQVRAVLIIDDEFIILESLRIQLSRILDDSILLEVASSGEEAFAIINEFHDSGPELCMVISDFHLDDIKGTEILTYAHEKFPNSKKIILSGQSDTGLINDFDNRIGLYDRFSKPWEFEEIKASIHKAIYSDRTD